LKEALSTSKRLNDFQSITVGYDCLGLSHFDKGDYTKAKEFFQELNETLEKAGDKSSQMNSSSFLVYTYIELGEIEKALNLTDSIYEFALRVKNRHLIATADTLKAMILRVQQRWEESIQLFEKSLEEFEATKARQWNPYFFAKMVLCEYARVRLERNQEGDREKTFALLNDALEIFQRMGAKKDIEEIIAKKKLLTA
jgi:tetratricopeptide (TPR) repeat protein